MLRVGVTSEKEGESGIEGTNEIEIVYLLEIVEKTFHKQSRFLPLDVVY